MCIGFSFSQPFMCSFEQKNPILFVKVIKDMNLVVCGGHNKK